MIEAVPHNFRSWLFVPADNARKTGKALNGASDVVILDLEDSVSPEGKVHAREMAQCALQQQSETARHVRVNALGPGLAEADWTAGGSVRPGRAYPLGRNGCARDTGKSSAIALRFCEIRTSTTIVAT